MRNRLTVSNKSIIKILLLLMIVFFYLLSNFTIGSIIIVALALMIFLIFWLPNNKGHAIPVSLNMLQIFVLLFGIYAFCTQFWAYDSSYARTKSITIIEMFVLITLIYYPLENLFDTDELLSVLKWSGYIVVIGAFIYYGIGTIVTYVVAGERIPSTFLNSNTLGMLSATTVTLAFYEILQKKIKISDLLNLLCIVIIAASGSRKAMVSLIFGCISIYLLLNQEKKISKRILGILGGVLIVIILFYIAYSFQLFTGVNRRLQFMINMIMGSGEVDHSALVRQSLLEIGMNQFYKTPFLGMGIDNTRFLARAYVHHDYYLHNNYVELLAGTGIVGTTLFYLIYVYLLVGMFKYRKNKDHTFFIILVLVITQLIMDYGSVSYYAKETYMNMIVFYIYLNSLMEKSINSLSVV